MFGREKNLIFYRMSTIKVSFLFRRNVWNLQLMNAIQTLGFINSSKRFKFKTETKNGEISTDKTTERIRVQVLEGD